MVKKLDADASRAGVRAHALATELFPIARSITGNGVRETLDIIGGLLPGFKCYEIPTGTSCFDWEVPREWNIRDAYIIGPDGEKVVDFKRHNLHVVGYSVPVDKELGLEELQTYLHSLPDQPDAIPYVTSYYKENWGFCLTHRQRQALKPGVYHAVIDSSLDPGCLTYGELFLPGETKEEIFLSTYVCHPSMGNNELSGPTVSAMLAQWLMERSCRRFTYRIVFIPETIGSVCYLSRHLKTMKSNVIAGFNVSCIGDERGYSYLPTKKGGTLADRIAMHVLSHHAPDYTRYSFLDRRSDERQYCSVGVDLPVVTIARSLYWHYPEYHTSLDDLELITPEGLGGGYMALRRCLECLEVNDYLVATMPCEPQLGKRGLYPTLSKGCGAKDPVFGEVSAMDLLNIWAYADGQHDLLDIANIIGLPLWKLVPAIRALEREGLLVSVCEVSETNE